MSKTRIESVALRKTYRVATGAVKAGVLFGSTLIYIFITSLSSIVTWAVTFKLVIVGRTRAMNTETDGTGFNNRAV